MPTYPFDHDGPVLLISDDNYEVAYYSHNKQKYKRVRMAPEWDWETGTVELISDEIFWLAVACIERRR